MYTPKHDRLEVKSVEPVRIVATVKDKAGNAVDVNTGVTGTYKLARKVGDPSLLGSYTITYSANVATVNFVCSNVQENGAQAYGDFIGQLTLTKSGDTLCVLEGSITINKVIL